MSAVRPQSAEKRTFNQPRAATRELLGAHLAASGASRRGGAYTPPPPARSLDRRSGPRSQAIGRQCRSAEEGFRVTEKFFRWSGRFSLGTPGRGREWERWPFTSPQPATVKLVTEVNLQVGRFAYGRGTVQHLLREAESLVRRGARSIIHQLDVVRTLEREGHDAEFAREFLGRKAQWRDRSRGTKKRAAAAGGAVSRVAQGSRRDALGAGVTDESTERLPVSQPRRSAERSDASQPVAGEMPSASVYQPHKSQDRSVLPVRDATDAAIH
jgi:hypothetical protein